jgi:hypothetical protein
MKFLVEIGLGIIFAAGCDARSLGMPRSTAPGEPGTDGHLSWLAGWDEAERAGPPTSYPPKKVSAFD